VDAKQKTASQQSQEFARSEAEIVDVRSLKWAEVQSDFFE